jgi:hypothetical protein
MVDTKHGQTSLTFFFMMSIPFWFLKSSCGRKRNSWSERSIWGCMKIGNPWLINHYFLHPNGQFLGCTQFSDIPISHIVGEAFHYIPVYSDSIFIRFIKNRRPHKQINIANFLPTSVKPPLYLHDGSQILNRPNFVAYSKSTWYSHDTSHYPTIMPTIFHL